MTSPLYLCLLLAVWFSYASCADDVPLQSLVTLVQQQAATIQNLQARVASLETSVQQQTTKLNKLETRAYLTAHMSQENVDIGAGTGPIRFDAVVENVGNGYNPVTGVFTAPFSGVYILYTQLEKDANIDNTIRFHIVKEGNVVCRNTIDSNAWDKSSCLTVVHVQKGETIFVTRYSGGSHLVGYWNCAFSAALISADGS